MVKDATTSWYDAHAKDFAKRTQHLDMNHLYQPFLERLPQGGKILDAGSGAGRDSKAFLKLGYDVTLLDASAELARVAESFTGRPVRVARFQEIDWLGEFDGIWACASLLHVPEQELLEVFERLARALKLGGVLYTSFKQGEGQQINRETGRHFTAMTEANLYGLVKSVDALDALQVWSNDDSRGGQQSPWVNSLFKRVTPSV